MDTLNGSNVEQLTSELSTMYEQYQDAQEVLDARHGHKGWGGEYIGPTEDERTAASEAREKIGKLIFARVVELFRSIGGQQAFEIYSNVVNSSPMRKAENGWNKGKPLNDQNFFTRVLIASTEKNPAIPENLDGEIGDVMENAGNRLSETL